MSKHTIAFDESAEGWSSYFSFLPDWMLRLGNRFFTIKDGQLYLHNDPTAPRNNFYGVQYKSKVSFAVNQEPSTIKVMKSLGLEGNQPWEVLIRAFQGGTEGFSESTIKDIEFIKKEGYWYAHTRRNELATDLSSKATYGIGIIISKFENTINIGVPVSDLAQGDVIFTEDGTEVGTVLEVRGTDIIMDRPVPNVEGSFIYGIKDARIEGAELRGYSAIVDIENGSTDKLELFAVNTEVFKSNR